MFTVLGSVIGECQSTREHDIKVYSGGKRDIRVILNYFGRGNTCGKPNILLGDQA